MTVAIWRLETGMGLDRCVLEESDAGHRISGTALLVSDGGGYELRYSVMTDPQWTTRSVGAHLQTPEGDRRLALNGDGNSAWFVGGDPVLDLFGAFDIELAWTPSTYMVPIRRLALNVGEAADVAVVQVSFPGRELSRVDRRYERKAEGVYRVSADGVATDMRVDEHGRVIDVPDRWVRLPVV